MAKSSTLRVNIVSDHDSRGFDDADSKLGKLSGTIAGIGAVVAVGGAALVGLATSAFDAASQLQQSTGAIDSVFGDWALDIEQSAQAAAGSVGLSTSAYENLASVVGAQLSGTGMAIGDVTNKTQDLVAKGADLAATFGGTTADAVGALSSALKGELDPIERYGVSLKQSDVNAELAARGLDKLEGSALKQAQAQVLLDLVTQQTTSSQGAFARESDTAAGSGAILSAKLENLQAALGEKLLPIFADVATFVSDKVIPTVERLTEKNGPVSDAFDKVSKIVKENVLPIVREFWAFAQDKLVPILKDVGSFITDTVVPAFRKVWEFIRDYVVPIFKSTLGPALDGAREAFRTVSEKINENKDKFQDAYDKAKPFFEFLRDKLAPFLGGTLKLAFETIGTVIGGVVDAIAFVLDKAGSVVGFVGDLFGAGGGGAAPGRASVRSAPQSMAPLRGAGTSTALRFGGGSSAVAVLPAAGDTYELHFHGIVDATDAAATIRALLDGDDRLRGRLEAVAL